MPADAIPADTKTAIKRAENPARAAQTMEKLPFQA